ncbi:lysophospholipase-like protein 1 [Drosophila sechellia]|uniref:palmitoyl-protein hydrolase n=1 Tax=Drosophila sechellia TaxID=7238 RepID=B4HIN9_DROSE|nr:lysophospholipase-like protein 1 [Drosophila sechellia]EDW42686.1 GM26145 [Drosophila sechellia]
MKPALTTVNATGKHSASVIFFHGSGDTGSNVMEWVRFLIGRNLEYPHIKIIYPTAPKQKYTPLDGELSNVWFDRKSVNIAASESKKSMSQCYDAVNQLIDEEVASGIPLNRIIVGGFSMGGTLALHTGYHLRRSLAGVFAHSSFLNRGSVVYDSLANGKAESFPELRMYHGERDTLVPKDWGLETFENLTKLGVKGTFHPLRNTLHELKTASITDLQQWIHEKLPPLENHVQNKL